MANTDDCNYSLFRQAPRFANANEPAKRQAPKASPSSTQKESSEREGGASSSQDATFIRIPPLLPCTYATQNRNKNIHGTKDTRSKSSRAINRAAMEEQGACAFLLAAKKEKKVSEKRKEREGRIGCDLLIRRLNYKQKAPPLAVAWRGCCAVQSAS